LRALQQTSAGRTGSRGDLTEVALDAIADEYGTR
jgi:hypothetical protein